MIFLFWTLNKQSAELPIRKLQVNKQFVEKSSLTKDIFVEVLSIAIFLWMKPQNMHLILILNLEMWKVDHTLNLKSASKANPSHSWRIINHHAFEFLIDTYFKWFWYSDIERALVMWWRWQSIPLRKQNNTFHSIH